MTGKVAHTDGTGGIGESISERLAPEVWRRENEEYIDFETVCAITNSGQAIQLLKYSLSVLIGP